MKKKISQKIQFAYKIFTVFAIFFVFLVVNTPVFSATLTPTAGQQGSTAAAELDKIQKIKEMVASRVAELNLVEKRGLFGTVKQTATTQLSIVDLSNNERLIDTDELTKFENLASSKSFGISDIKSGDLISAIGLYNKDTKHLLARFVNEVKPLPIQFEGAVISLDGKNYEITIEDSNNNKKTVEIETSTKTRSLAKAEGLFTSGFSKIGMNQRILVTGFYDPKDGNRILASRIIHFTDIPAFSELTNPSNASNSAAAQPSVTPTVAKKSK